MPYKDKNVPGNQYKGPFNGQDFCQEYRKCNQLSTVGLNQQRYCIKNRIIINKLSTKIPENRNILFVNIAQP